MITEFVKVTLIGLRTQKSEALAELQALGCLHLISLKPQSKTSLTTVSTTLLEQLTSAIKHLKDSPEQRCQRLDWKEVTPQHAIELVLNNKQKLRQHNDQLELLRNRILELSEWGDFKLPAEGDLSTLKLWFYKINLKQLNSIPKHYPIQELHRNNRYAYLVIFCEIEPAEKFLMEQRVHTGSLSLNHVRAGLDEVENTMEDLISERRTLTQYRYLLSQEIAQFSDRTQLNKAAAMTHEEQAFFLIQGWVPKLQLDKLEHFSEQHQFALTIEPPGADELPPTLLSTHPWFKAGAELVSFYQTPGYHSLDPSFMVFFSFSIFFAMILADAGYGIILAVFTGCMWKRLGKSKTAAWLRPLLVSLSSFSILYGVLLGSYWGVEPRPESVLANLKIIDINNFNAMMALVIGIGCIHLCVASGMRAWFADSRRIQAQSMGTILVIVAALILSWGLTRHAPQITHLSYLFFALGLLLTTVFASNEPIASFKSLALRVFHGFIALAELPSLFGDLLSYLRLFALGLAGASLAITFNTIAHHVAHTSWVLAALILLIGQTLNFVLCLMSALIHGLRLNYIEFFKWSIKEEGYGFQPLKKQEISDE